MKGLNLFLLTATFLFAGCDSDAPKEEIKVKKYSSEVEERINRIVNNLQVETSLKETYKKASLTERLKHYKTPGVSIAIINNGEVEWAQGFGIKEWGKEEVVDENTLFQAGSVSKPVFALGVMRLKEKGLIDLDTDVNTYLSSWKIPSNEDWQPKITLRQLVEAVFSTPFGVVLTRAYTPGNASWVSPTHHPGLFTLNPDRILVWSPSGCNAILPIASILN